MKRRKKWLSGIFAAVAMTLLMGQVGTMPVYAGDINSAEAMIISFYNSTFQYQGKSYVATEAAKSAAYNKLAQDGVDLTSSEARSAIAQANSKIAQGIAQGILVEVNQSQGDEGSDNEADADTNTSDEQTSQNEENQPASSDTTPSNKEETPKESTTTDKAQEKVADSDTKTSKSGDEQDDSKSSESSESSESSAVQEYVESLIQETSGKKSQTIVRKDGENYRILNYETGEETTMSSDGKVLSQSSIPLKTKAITTDGSWGYRWIVIIVVIALLIVLGIVLRLSRKKGKGKKSYKQLRMLYSIASSVVICASVALFFTNLGMYVLTAGLTDAKVLSVMVICLVIAIVFGMLLWLQYHYKHRAMRYLACSMGAATVINAVITVFLCRGDWMDSRSFLLIGVEALLTLICFRLMVVIKKKSR